MELGGYGFEKSELIDIAEKIHKYKGEKQQLEVQLSSEEFHRSYIPKRENMTGGRIMANLPIVLAFSLGVLILAVTVVCCIIADSEDKIGYAFPMLGAGLFVAYMARTGFPLLKEELQMLVLFAYSSKPERAMRFAKKHSISTFQDDRLRCDERISNLKAQIEAIDESIAELEKRQNDLIDAAKKREDVLKKYDIIKDENPNNILGDSGASGKPSLSLKKNDMDSVDISELYEYYDKEESFTRYIIKDLEFKLDSVNKEMSMIDEEFEQVKKRIIIFIIILIFAAVIQGAIHGIIGDLIGVVCFIAGVVAVFAIERACRGPIIRYLVEQESPLVSEYCFKYDVIPVKHRRQKILAMIKQNEAALADVKNRKQMLDDVS